MNDADIINMSLYYLVAVMFVTLPYNIFLFPDLTYSIMGAAIQGFCLISTVCVILLWILLGVNE